MAHILVVEDDSALQYSNCAILEQAGHVTRGFADYRGVLELLETDKSVDLMLIDVAPTDGTPNGQSVARMARLKRHRMPVVFVSGYPDLAQYLKEETFLTKPVSDEVLLEAVGVALSHA